MARRLPARVLVHTATPMGEAPHNVDPDALEWVEGEPGDETSEVAGVPFACIVFLPQSGETVQAERSWRPRVITEPLMLYNLTRSDGSQVTIGKDDELDILAADLEAVTGAALVRWQVAGVPQAFGPPGRTFACQAALKRAVD